MCNDECTNKRRYTSTVIHLYTYIPPPVNVLTADQSEVGSYTNCLHRWELYVLKSSFVLTNLMPSSGVSSNELMSSIRLDWASVCVAATRTNQALEIQFFGIGTYAYYQGLKVINPNVTSWIVIVEVLTGSVGIVVNHTDLRAPDIAYTEPIVAGKLPLSDWYIIRAVAICLRLAFLARSFALALALESLGSKAAAKIPMITITISISISVNALFVIESIQDKLWSDVRVC